MGSEMCIRDSKKCLFTKKTTSLYCNSDQVDHSLMATGLDFIVFEKACNRVIEFNISSRVVVVVLIL